MSEVRTAYGTVKDNADTWFSRITGLPGYKPPFPVRVGYYFATVFSSISISALVVGFILIVFDFMVHGSEYILGELNSFPISVMIIGVGFITMILAGILSVIAEKVSVPFERQYQSWLSDVIPKNAQNKYPPQEYWELVREEPIPDPPKWAPREIREPTLSEKIGDFFSIIFSGVFFLMVRYLLVTHLMFLFGKHNHRASKRKDWRLP